MGRTCYGRSGAEPDERHKAGGGRGSARPARWGGFVCRGIPTPCPTRDPPLSGQGNRQGRSPAREAPLFFPLPEACGDTAGIPFWVGVGASPREQRHILPYRWRDFWRWALRQYAHRLHGTTTHGDAHTSPHDAEPGACPRRSLQQPKQRSKPKNPPCFAQYMSLPSVAFIAAVSEGAGAEMRGGFGGAPQQAQRQKQRAFNVRDNGC